MTTTLTIGYSPCPNDTFIFYALVHGRVTVPGIAFCERLEDVDIRRPALNWEPLLEAWKDVELDAGSEAWD